MWYFKELQQIVHNDAVENGWWNEGVDTDPIAKLSLVIAEAVEAIEEYRNWHEMDEVYYHDGKPEGVPVELADIVIRVLDLAARYGINLEEVIREKLTFNRTRGYRHGNKRF